MTTFSHTSLLISTTLLLLTACSKETTEAPKDLTVQKEQAAEAKIESKEELEAKAAKGDAHAQFELGAMYHDGQGVQKDLTIAKQWFEKSAALGDVRAQFNLGVMYYTAEGIKQNYAKAKELFQKTADQGNARGQFNLGVMYYRGEGMKQNLAKAADLFTKAGMQNFQEAQFNIGVMEAKGEGRTADIGKAYAWFSLAQENGNTRTAEVLKNIEREVTPEELAILKKMAEELKTKVQENVAKIVAEEKAKK